MRNINYLGFILLVISAFSSANNISLAQPTLKIEKEYNQPQSDYFIFALNLLPKAQQGDAISQFYLYKTIINCLMTDVHIDELHYMISKNKTDNSTAQQYYAQLNDKRAKCAGIRENINQLTIVNEWEWLKKSANNQYAPAMVLYAISNITYNDQSTASSTQDVSLFNLSKQQAYQMLITGILKKHNEAYFYLSLLTTLSAEDRMAWVLLAQNQGLTLFPENPLNPWLSEEQLTCLDKNEINVQANIICLVKTHFKHDEKALRRTQVKVDKLLGLLNSNDKEAFEKYFNITL